MTVPGIFSLGSPGAIEDAYALAGFQDVQVRVLSATFLAPVRTDVEME